MIEMYATSIHDGLEPDSGGSCSTFRGFLARGVRGGHPGALKKKYAELYGGEDVVEKVRTDKRQTPCGRERERAEATSRMLLLSRLHEPVTYGAIVIVRPESGVFREVGFDGVDEKALSRVLAATTRTSFLKLRSATIALFPRPRRGALKKGAER